MPNNTIYLNTINSLEKTMGYPIPQKDEIVQKLQNAWNSDETPAKVNYLAEYRNVFRQVFAIWIDGEFAKTFNARSEKTPDFKNCLLKTDEALKTCALALLPKLRENQDVLSNMTFGVMSPEDLKNEFITVREKYLTAQAAKNHMEKRKAAAYDKYKTEWAQTSTRKIAGVVNDTEKLDSMSRTERIDFALALYAFRNDPQIAVVLSEREKELLDTALTDWQKELNFLVGETFESFIEGEYFQYTQKFAENDWLATEVTGAIDQFNKVPNYAQQEIANYKELEKATAINSVPNRSIYLNTINGLEKTLGIPIPQKDEMAKKLQDAWKNDATPAKENYLAEYKKVFSGVLQAYSDSQYNKVFNSPSEKNPDFKNCLLKTDKALKTCALALIPELRDNQELLKSMAFGGMRAEELKNEFTATREKYLTSQAANTAMQKRRTEALEKYSSEWALLTPRKIAAVVKDTEKLAAMSRDEKIDFAFALATYRVNRKIINTLSERDKELLDTAILDWKKELQFAPRQTFANFVENEYLQSTQKFAGDGWIETAVTGALDEYNKDPNAAQKELADYQKLQKTTADIRSAKERTVPIAENWNDGAEMVGDFFMQEELSLELAEMSAQSEQGIKKERAFLEEKINDFNKRYSLRINKDKFRESVEQVSVLMVKAREDKERLLDKDNVIVIENGKETCHKASEYFKKEIEAANKNYNDKVKELEEARTNDPTKKDEIDEQIQKAKADLDNELSAMKGGVVIEKSEKTNKRYTFSQYYETHETKMEQEAYREYQKIFIRCYKDACQNLKEQNYAKGKVTDFSDIAKDTDKMLKAALYFSNVYDNEKNVELIQKCNFGGFSAEQLASVSTNLNNDSWMLEQNSEVAWTKQITNAKNIYARWQAEERTNRKVDPSLKIKTVLDEKRIKFQKSEITKKEMLDYVIAAESHMLSSYPTKFSQRMSPIKYRREKNALLACRAALGLKEGDSLRVAMSEEYKRLAGFMSKEEVFRSIGKEMNRSQNFKEEKEVWAKEHQIARDKVVAEKVAKLEALKAKDKEPISIPELDERQVILKQQPRVQPIVALAQLKPTLNVQK